MQRQVRHYNLDAIISVGYRISSAQATRFRQWATSVLRQHLTQGFTLNRQRFEQNAAELEATLALVRKAAAGEALTTAQGRGLVEQQRGDDSPHRKHVGLARVVPCIAVALLLGNFHAD